MDYSNQFEACRFRVRGLLGSTLRLFFCVGILLAYIYGAVLPFYVVPWASMSFSIVFLYSFWYVPETPMHLLKIGNYDVGSDLVSILKSVRFFDSEVFREQEVL